MDDNFLPDGVQNSQPPSSGQTQRSSTDPTRYNTPNIQVMMDFCYPFTEYLACSSMCMFYVYYFCKQQSDSISTVPVFIITTVKEKALFIQLF